MVEKSEKKRFPTFVLCLFLGGLGIHRFYAGKVGTGILWLFSFGAFGIGAFVDLIMILSGSFKDKEGKLILDWTAQKEKLGAGPIIGIFAGWFVLWIIIGLITSAGSYERAIAPQVATAQKENVPEKAEEALPSVGVPVRAGYFEVMVNNASIEEWINTGNQFTDLNRETGIKYLVINVTFKNIDKKSRMMFDGELYIDYAGQEYNFDTETLLAEGWGLFLDTINPLTFKTTNLVYKLPAEVMGPITWKPTGARTKIYVGNINPLE